MKRKYITFNNQELILTALGEQARACQQLAEGPNTLSLPERDAFKQSAWAYRDLAKGIADADQIIWDEFCAP